MLSIMGGHKYSYVEEKVIKNIGHQKLEIIW